MAVVSDPRLLMLHRPWLRAFALVGALAIAAYLISARDAVVAEDDDED